MTCTRKHEWAFLYTWKIEATRKVVWRLKPQEKLFVDTKGDNSHSSSSEIEWEQVVVTIVGRGEEN